MYMIIYCLQNNIQSFAGKMLTYRLLPISFINMRRCFLLYVYYYVYIYIYEFLFTEFYLSQLDFDYMHRCGHYKCNNMQWMMVVKLCSGVQIPTSIETISQKSMQTQEALLLLTLHEIKLRNFTLLSYP